MINLIYTFKKITLAIVFSSVTLFANAPIIQALTLTGAFGAYIPSDHLVRQLYGSSLTGSVQLGFAYYETFDWTITTSVQKFQNENVGVKSDITLTSLLFGFEKRLPAPESDHSYVEPFIGAGVNLVYLSDSLKYNNQDSTHKDSFVYGFYWEAGLLFPASSDSWFVVDWKQSNIARMVYGDINLGGTVFSLGYRFEF